tara:strand:- start:700 stop:969 length:270 start_codon:yes stop_codon:yes gene_type:complete
MNIDNNPELQLAVAKDTELKQIIVNYVGNKNVEDEQEGEIPVTVQMIAETLATEFPEFMLAIAEENWIRGYKQGLDDAELHKTKTTTDS